MQYIGLRVICSPNEKCLDFTLCRFYARFAEFHVHAYFVRFFHALSARSQEPKRTRNFVLMCIYFVLRHRNNKVVSYVLPSN